MSMYSLTSSLNECLCIFSLYTVILKMVGGEIPSASALAPKLGPMGLVS
jgi:hypothetical protein